MLSSKEQSPFGFPFSLLNSLRKQPTPPLVDTPHATQAPPLPQTSWAPLRNVRRDANALARRHQSSPCGPQMAWGDERTLMSWLLSSRSTFATYIKGSSTTAPVPSDHLLGDVHLTTSYLFFLIFCMGHTLHVIMTKYDVVRHVTQHERLFNDITSVQRSVLPRSPPFQSTSFRWPFCHQFMTLHYRHTHKNFLS